MLVIKSLNFVKADILFLFLTFTPLGSPNQISRSRWLIQVGFQVRICLNPMYTELAGRLYRKQQRKPRKLGKAGSNMILHYDGKLVKEYTDGKKLKRKRLAVSVTCDEDHFLLGVTLVTDSTGACQTEEIIEILEENSLKEDIKGLVLDTTASNTLKEKGVNSRLNSYLGKTCYASCM